INSGPLEALQATGANRLQTIVYAVIPQILPPFISFTIYRWDINVRMATIIGLVGGGGIGQRLLQLTRNWVWDQAIVLMLLIMVAVWAMDYSSSRLRERLN
ncbi:MAG: ABC transporter permease subunit, partial [Candidatus Bipolaricaulota bacterium]